MWEWIFPDWTIGSMEYGNQKMRINGMVLVLLMVTAPVFSFDPSPVTEIRYRFSPVVMVVSGNSPLYGSLECAVQTEPGDIVRILTENRILPSGPASFETIYEQAQKMDLNMFPLDKMVNHLNEECRQNMRYDVENRPLSDADIYPVMKPDMKEDMPGLTVRITVKSPPDVSLIEMPETVTVDYAFEITLLDNRDPVPGQSRDVRKPRLLKRRIAGTDIIEVSTWKLLATMMSRSRETPVEDLIIVLGLVELRLPRILNAQNR